MNFYFCYIPFLLFLTRQASDCLLFSCQADFSCCFFFFLVGTILFVVLALVHSTILLIILGPSLFRNSKSNCFFVFFLTFVNRNFLFVLDSVSL